MDMENNNLDNLLFTFGYSNQRSENFEVDKEVPIFDDEEELDEILKFFTNCLHVVGFSSIGHLEAVRN